MMALAISWIVKYIMTNFLYTFGGEDRNQEDGSPIGDEISQASSRMVGAEYDEKFQIRMEDLGVPLELYERYADDQNLAARSIGREAIFCPQDGVLKRKGLEQIQEESDIREDILVMREIRKIADTIIPMLKQRRIVLEAILNLGLRYQY